MLSIDTDLPTIVSSGITEPSQLTRSVLVGVPQGAAVRLLSARGLNSVPITLRSLDEPLRNAEPNPLVEISQPFAVRGRRMVNIRVNPVREDLVFNEVEISIGFDRAAVQSRAATVDPVFDRIFASSLANWDQARQWSIPAVARTASSLQLASDNDLAGSDAWFKVAVAQTGLYRISGADMASAGIPLAGLNPDSIRLYNAGGLRCQENNDSARPSFDEVAIIVEDGGDTRFDAGDHFLFFGEAVDRWRYQADMEPEYVDHPYTAQNIYWLTVSGAFSAPAKRMAEIDGTPSGLADTTISDFLRRTHTEQDGLLSKRIDKHIWDYFTWYWTDETYISFFVPTPTAMPGETAEVNLVGNTNTGTGGASYMNLSVNGTAATKLLSGGTRCLFETASLTDGLSRLEIDLGPISGDVPPYFNYAEITYRSRLRPDGGELDITLDSYDGRGLLEVDDNFTAEPMILDLTDPLRPSFISGYEQTGDLLSFEVDLEAGGPNRFYCAVPEQALAPVSIAAAPITDLRNVSEQADLIVVTTAALAPYLDDYVTLCEIRGKSIKIALVGEIVDNFGYGLYDPTAVRDYLKFAYENYPTPRPSAVLFVGDGNYDFLDHIGTGQANHVPPYIRTSDLVYSDDAYVHFGGLGLLDSDSSWIIVPDRGFDMMTARWPVSSGSQVTTITEKIKRYEAADDFGFWRSNIALVADDQYVSGVNNREIIHTVDTETLEKDHLPAQLSREKIYLWDFPFVNQQKPAVNDAIVNAFNNGSLVINYVGHGNPDVWAHEHVFERTSDLPRLDNPDRLPLVYAASCAISFFDDPRREGMGEALLNMVNSGAVGIIAATRLVFSNSNAVLNRQVFDVLFGDDSLSICEALYAAKLQLQYPGPVRRTNDQKYVFFGDPLLRLAIPELEIAFTQAPDSLVALGRARVAGQVIDGNDQLVPQDGALLIRVLDSDREKRLLVEEDDTASVSFKMPGPSIYRGSATITAGTFDFEFIVPLDVGYGGTGAKVAVYAILDAVDGLGLADSIAISETVTSTTDSTGPEITFTVAGRSNFISGDMVSRSDFLDFRLSDPLGINLADNLGHGISLEIDGDAENRINLTDLFEYDLDDITSGRLLYSLESMTTGEHQFRIKAWDNANNLSVSSFSAKIAASTRMAINEFLNYPNPMMDSTTFYFELTQPARTFSLEIFTLSGRKIMGFTRYDLAADNYPTASVSLGWNGRDDDGDRVATGVYIYKASAQPEIGGEEVELFGKVVVIN